MDGTAEIKIDTSNMDEIIEKVSRLNVIGLDIDKNTVQRMESGERFITDIELGYLAKVFDVTIEELLRR